MWSKLSQRLTDPLFYRKRWLQLSRRLRPPRTPRPVALEHLLEKSGPVLVLIAHPDDELFASCLLCELTARGRPFHIACLTRGEGGITGERGSPPERCGRAARSNTDEPPVSLSRRQLGQQREAELRSSAAALGAASVIFLDHIDPLGKAHRTYAPQVSVIDLAAQIRGLVEQFQPSIIVTHGSGGEYWHPAHLLVHRAVFLAAENRLPVLTIHASQADHALPSLLNRDDPADLVLDGGPHRQQRLAAFRAHASQHDYFATHGGGSLEGYIDLTACEAFRHYPAGIVA